MMKHAFRLISALLCVVMACSILCITAFAASNSVDYKNRTFTGMEGLKELISDYNGKDEDHARPFDNTENELVITENITIPGYLRIGSGRIVIPEGVTVTLDNYMIPDGGRLDAGTLVVEGTLINNGTVFLWNASEVYGKVINNGMISIADYKDGQDGYLSFYGGKYSGCGSIYMVADTFENTYFRISGLNEYDFAYGFYSRDGIESTCVRVLYSYFNSDIKPAPGVSVPMFRMYDPNCGEHFYTGSTQERFNLLNAGWNYEDVGFNFPASGKPVYRLYHRATGEHLYTMNETEKSALVSNGWQLEGVAFNSAKDTEVAQYRLHNPNASRGAYHFTGSAEERDNLISLGWEDQGIGWYSCLN